MKSCCFKNGLQYATAEGQQLKKAAERPSLPLNSALNSSFKMPAIHTNWSWLWEKEFQSVDILGGTAMACAYNSLYYHHFATTSTWSTKKAHLLPFQTSAVNDWLDHWLQWRKWRKVILLGILKMVPVSPRRADRNVMTPCKCCE